MSAVIDYQNDVIKIYMNGQKKAEQVVNFSSSTTPGTNSSCVNVGAQEFGASKVLNGEMDDVRIYSKALTDQEILSIFNNGRE